MLGPGPPPPRLCAPAGGGDWHRRRQQAAEQPDLQVQCPPGGRAQLLPLVSRLSWSARLLPLGSSFCDRGRVCVTSLHQCEAWGWQGRSRGSASVSTALSAYIHSSHLGAFCCTALKQGPQPGPARPGPAAGVGATGCPSRPPPAACRVTSACCPPAWGWGRWRSATTAAPCPRRWTWRAWPARRE